MKYLIINADDFGNYTATNKGILHGIEMDVITSTSVMVNRNHLEDVEKLLQLPDISIGLHFEMPTDSTPIIEEFEKQIETFKHLVGKKPDHIDSHKIRPRNIEDLIDYLEQYSKDTHTPIRDWGHAHLIDTFFGLRLEGTGSMDLDKITPQGLIKALDEGLREGYNELMTHAGYVDEEVMKGSSYNKPRETELHSLLSSEFKEYLAAHSDIQLVSWKAVKV